MNNSHPALKEFVYVVMFHSHSFGNIPMGGAHKSREQAEEYITLCVGRHPHYQRSMYRITALEVI